VLVFRGNHRGYLTDTGMTVEWNGTGGRAVGTVKFLSHQVVRTGMDELFVQIDFLIVLGELL
jgi:hypothetical protein